MIFKWKIGKKAVAGDHLNVPALVRVSTVEELEAALAAQTSKQVIEVSAGVYNLTKSNSIPVAASYGVLRGLGDVEINGEADADECILINPAAAAATFKYTFDNIRVRGATDKAGITVDNKTVAKKMVLVFRNCSLGGTPALDVDHTLTTEAIRIYFDGWKGDKRYQGEIDITPANTEDRFYFKGVDLAGGLKGAVVDIACQYLFRNCILKHEGITGGHANNKLSVVGCITYVSSVAAAADSSDFPNAFSPTLLSLT